MAPRLTLPLAVFLLLGGAALACSSTTVIEQKAVPGPGEEDGGTEDAPPPRPEVDAGVDAAKPFVFTPAPKGTFAQAVSFGGAVVKTPKIVPIIYTGDPQKQVIIDFSNKMATAAYWGQISSEYGVGALTTKTPIILNELPPTNIDDSQIASWLVSKFSSDAARFGTPDSSTLYVIYYPSSTTVTQGGSTGCDSFGGYHYETNVGATPIAYSVLPRCAAFAGLGGSDVTTFASSHEILEWATDPFPASRPAYMAVDDDHAVWSRVFLGELGDLCTQMGDVAIAPADLGFTVQRTWSNLSAQGGHHPCAPTTKLPYFTAFPTAPERISATDEFGRQISTKGFKVGVGQSKTVDLTLYADADAGVINIQVLDITKLYGIQPEFSYSLARAYGQPGDTLKLTITGERSATQGQGFLIVSQTKKDQNIFPVWVTN
ncbi:MAG TPA: hypothetical protein VLT33_43985 [Labilithrix sp.]|nr:hypothetical protein [Labilithrix sp.]